MAKEVTETEQHAKIRRLTVLSLFSDDNLMERLVLKGGSVLSMFFGLDLRTSLDLDFSMPGDFASSQLDAVEDRISRRLSETFTQHGYHVFDVGLSPRPSQLRPEQPASWGGYRLEFKLIDADTCEKFRDDLPAMRRQATVVGAGQKRIVKVDISKHEECSGKQERSLEGLTVYCYTPTMTVCEKLRAICQQMPSYASTIGTTTSARARDFFDIHALVERFRINLATSENVDLLHRMFGAKAVPVVLIKEIRNYREYHRPDFEAVQATVEPTVPLEDFDFYFEYVVTHVAKLEALGVI